MELHSWALVAAGGIGSLVAVFHGVVTQKKMVDPILRETKFPDSTRRLVPLLLHFSTLCWFFGGAALIATPLMSSEAAVLTTASFVGTFYAFGAVGNFWGTRGRHPGWILLAVAVSLILFATIPAFN